MQKKDKNQKIVIIGASSAMAEHCARIWVAKANIDLVLVARDEAKLQQISDDLKVRNPQTIISLHTVDFISPTSIADLVSEINVHGAVDIALIAHGNLPEQNQCQESLMACFDALNVNGLSPVLFAEAFALHMQLENKGTIAIIGSVAGDRGRKSNYVYGAAKGLVSRYAQGLQHRFANSNVKVVLIKPGPTNTPMTASLTEQGAKMASVELVATNIVDGIAAGKSVVYTPVKWAMIMMVIRNLPNIIFNKLNI